MLNEKAKITQIYLYITFFLSAPTKYVWTYVHIFLYQQLMRYPYTNLLPLPETRKLQSKCNANRLLNIILHADFFSSDRLPWLG